MDDKVTDDASQMEYGKPTPDDSDDSDSEELFNTDKLDSFSHVVAFNTAFAEIMELKAKGIASLLIIREKKRDVKRLEFTIEDQDQEFLETEGEMTNLSVAIELKEGDIKDLAGQHKILFDKATETKALEDRLAASKVEFNLSKANMELAHMQMDFLELETGLQPQNELMTDLKFDLATEREALGILQKELIELQEEFKKKCAAIPFPEVDNASYNLQSQLAAANDVIEDQANQIQMLQSQLENAAAIQCIHDDTAIKDLTTKIQELELKTQLEIQQSKVFRDFSFAIRARKYEFDVRGRPKNQVIINNGEDGVKIASVLVDAIMFTDPANTIPYNEFEACYNGVPAIVICEHMDFTMFHDILNWYCNMKKWGKFYGVANMNGAFVASFHLLFKKIFPMFEVSSNENILQDPILNNAYETLAREHNAARMGWLNNTNRPFFRPANATPRAASISK